MLIVSGNQVLSRNAVLLEGRTVTHLTSTAVLCLLVENMLQGFAQIFPIYLLSSYILSYIKTGFCIDDKV